MSQPNLSDSADAAPAQDPGYGPQPTRGVVMKWRKAARAATGIALILLGLLWILQGADLVRIRPILCVANCQPVTGGSAGWLAAGAVTVVVGLAMVAARRWRR